MSTDRIPPLPALDPDDLDWLLNRLTPLTFEALDAFINYQEPLPPHIPPDGYRTRFSVSNVLTSPQWGSAPRQQMLYDLRFLPHTLADAYDTALLVPDPPDPYWSRPADPASDPAGEAHWQRLLQTHRDHTSDVGSVCHGLEMAWEHALAQYDAAAPYSSPRCCGRPNLYLIPNVSLPSRDLVRDLARRRETRHLILLTARHELGHFYRRVVEWRDRAEGRQELDRRDVCFDPWYRGWIAARRRGHWYSTCAQMTSQPFDGSAPFVRNDAPAQEYIYQSALAWLYGRFEEWYMAAYRRVTNPRECRLDGCHRIPPAGKVYCSDEHKDEARRDTFRKSTRKRKEAKRKEGEKLFATQLQKAQVRRTR